MLSSNPSLIQVVRAALIGGGVSAATVEFLGGWADAFDKTNDLNAAWAAGMAGAAEGMPEGTQWDICGDGQGSSFRDIQT